MKKTILLTALFAAALAPAQAALVITEVAPWGSQSTVPYMTDWFEVTNTGTSSVTITGWKMDDNSHTFSSAVALAGINSIAAGESVIFTENEASTSFKNTWFGANVPAGLQIGTYTGGGVGLSGSGDEVNLYDAGGTLQTAVGFGTSASAAPFATFENPANLTTTATLLTTLSVAGTRGAFVAANDSTETGSPGRIAAPVPEPSTALAVIGGVSMLLGLRRRRA